MGKCALTNRTRNFTARGRTASNLIPLAVTCAVDGALSNEVEIHPSVWVGVTCISNFFSIGDVSQRSSCVVPDSQIGTKDFMPDFWRQLAQLTHRNTAAPKAFHSNQDTTTSGAAF